MELDLGTAIAGLIMILMCIIPFVVMHYSRLRKENNMLQSLNKIAAKQNCKIWESEICGDYIIGVDEAINFVFFFKQKKEEAISQYVNLSTIHACEVNRQTTRQNCTKRLELIFIPSYKNTAVTAFELFDEPTNLDLSGEVQCGDKWLKKINDSLKSKQHNKKRAA